jgi:hypothetical protein
MPHPVGGDNSLPDLGIQYAEVMQQCYDGALDLEREYFRFFHFPEISIVHSFGVHGRADLFIMDVTARIGG